ncbi:MAG: class I SAM-dependent methyltransferase [Bacteroidales bacterium]
MVHYNSCPLCSSDKIAFYLECTDYLVTHEVFSLFRCQSCGFVFTQDHPDEEEIGKYYESQEYASHDDKAGGLLNRVYFFVRGFMLGRKRHTVEKATGLRRGKLLDIGCGTGYFAGAMKKAGWDVEGIEPNRKARDFAASHFKINIYEPDATGSLAAASFDCITLWHVLEHFQDPFRYIGEIERLLKPGGICLAALPNKSSSDARYYGRFWAAWDVPRHLWHFDPETMELFRRKSGFKIITTKRLLPDGFYISMLSEKNKCPSLPLITGLLLGIRFTFASAFRRSRSSSLVYILRKPAD